MSSFAKNLLLVSCLLATLINSDARDIELKDRIMRGNKGKIEDWPWVVSVFKVKSQIFTIGTGSIVHKKWVLTAAHIVYDSDK
jgi:secreted trypsin-like serine protease